MSSSAGSGGGKNGGILRSSSSSSSSSGTTKKRHKNAMEVTFGGPTSPAISRPTRPSPSDQEDNEYGGGGGSGGRGNGGNGTNGNNGDDGGGSGSGGGYDSDDLYDASMAAGGVLPSALSTGGGNTKEGRTNDDDDGLPHDQAEIDAARRQRRKKLADSELADRADEIQRLEEEEEDHNGNGGSSGSKMGSLGGNNQNHQRGGEFRGEEDLDAGLSLISSTAAADPSSANPADPNAISGAYDAGSNAACPVEPFNLKAEREGGEGYFDGDTYAFRRLEEGGRAMDEEPDAWLDELGGRDASGGQAGGAGDVTGGIARLSNAKASKKKQQALDLDDVPHEELCSRIAALLAGDKETVARGLKRYGDVIARDRKRRQKLAKKRRRGGGKKDGGEVGEDGMDAQGKTTDEDDGVGVAAAQKALSDLTDLADAVLMGGDGEVYSRTKEELVRMSSVADTGAGDNEDNNLAGHKRKRNYFGGDGGDANGDGNGDSSSKMAKVAGGEAVQTDKKASVQWEYRGNQDQQIHGPYTTEQMLGWIQAGYFVGEAAVDVRRVAPANGGGGGAGNDDAAAKKAAETATADDLMADLMDSDDDEGGEEAQVETDAANKWERSDKVDFKSYL